MWTASAHTWGSSPRGRGKPTEEDPHPYVLGLIPARAGKTTAHEVKTAQKQAHPRAGGENGHSAALIGGLVGSSPRGRGKRGRGTRRCRHGGLIPARAGKTYPHSSRIAAIRAHPRAGGENAGVRDRPGLRWGSSPRGRGKRGARGGRGAGHGLIPARAGKTGDVPSHRKVRRAHPRAGGENLRAAGLRAVVVGSSPRGRGKLLRHPRCDCTHGLIPARAGKTFALS